MQLDNVIIVIEILVKLIEDPIEKSSKQKKVIFIPLGSTTPPQENDKNIFQLFGHFDQF